MRSSHSSGPIDDNLRKPYEHLLARYQTDPQERAKNANIRSFNDEVYKEGMLSKVLQKAENAILNSPEIKKLLAGTAHAQTQQEFEEFKIPFETLVAAVTDSAVLAKMPLGPHSGLAGFLCLAPLLADNAVNLIMRALEPQQVQIPIKTQKALEAFLQTLIGLKFQAMPDNELQAIIPRLKDQSPQAIFRELKQLKESALQLVLPRFTGFESVEFDSVEQVTGELLLAKKEFAELFAIAENESVDTKSLAAIKTMPEEALKLLSQVATLEKAPVSLILGIFVANRQIVHHTILRQPYEELRVRRDIVKDKWERESLTLMTAEETTKLALIDQLLTCAPILANYLIIKQLLIDLEDGLKARIDKNASGTKALLFYACVEIRQIASGKPSAEYHPIGILHTEIEKLIKKLTLLLPPKLQDFSSQNAQSCTAALSEHLLAIKQENRATLSAILKTHPRTLLYLLYTNSTVVDDISIPYTPAVSLDFFTSLGEQLNQLAKQKEYNRFQPRVLKILLDDSKKDPLSDVSKCALRVIYKAMTDMISTLDQNPS